MKTEAQFESSKVVVVDANNETFGGKVGGRKLRKQSSSSTLCSTPPPVPTDIISIIHTEERRYKRKGYGLISATLIALTYFYCGPLLCYAYWPKILNWIETNGIEQY
jgi:hypothetical protein